MNVSTIMPMEYANGVLGKEYQRIVNEYGGPIYCIDGRPYADEEGVISLDWLFLYPHRIKLVDVLGAK